MRLVYEDEYGAYSGVRPEFLNKFVPVEVNPNFDVYDSKDGHVRFIASKCSRVPYDDDMTAGRYGIDLFRTKPALAEALDYGAMLPEGYRWNKTIAFAARNREEYVKKAAVWDNYNSFIWDKKPQTVWVAPHSGSVNCYADSVVFDPREWLDNFTAGVTALCAYKDNNKPEKRNIVYIHRTTTLGAVINLGGLSVLDEAKLQAAAEKVERKYHKKVQYLADDFKDDFRKMINKLFEHLLTKRGTIDPEQLNNLLDDHSSTMRLMIRGLKTYGQDIKEYTPQAFEKALANLRRMDVQVANMNLLFLRVSGITLQLPEKIKQGLLSSAFGVECSGTFTAKDPELVASIILDVKKELFGLRKR